MSQEHWGLRGAGPTLRVVNKIEERESWEGRSGDFSHLHHVDVTKLKLRHEGWGRGGRKLKPKAEESWSWR